MKRKRESHRDQRAARRRKLDHKISERPTWPLLRQYYPEVLTLRQYLLCKLPTSSKRRRRKLAHYGIDGTDGFELGADASAVELLDSIIVGTFNRAEISEVESIDKDITIFTQQLSDSTATISATQGALQQCEIVDFVIWSLFRRHQGPYRPSHILSHGYQRYATGPNNGVELAVLPGVPGVLSNCRNQYVQTMKEHPWCALPLLLGKVAECIISNMLIHCGIFQPVNNSTNLQQLSGVPLCDLKPLKRAQLEQTHCPPEGNGQPGREAVAMPSDTRRGLSDIRFVRHRMLYAKSALGAKGNVHFGLSHLHVLNQYRQFDVEGETKHVLKYMFPLQFGLHNVFTSAIDPKDTAQPFKDYTLRDQEIARSTDRWRQKRRDDNNTESGSEPPVPRRLRRQALSIVARLRKRHNKFSYASLLQHYCPPQSCDDPSVAGSFQQASPPAQVFAFCRAALAKVFPGGFWGIGDVRDHNNRMILQSVDKLIRFRRYETLSLHDVLQGLRIHDIDWLQPQNVNQTSNLSQTDFVKRKELMAELLYYLFDSYLIPLIRGHFHVTESGAHRNQLFYFRHDIWKAMSEPVFASLKNNMLEECNTVEIRKKLAKRALGVSQVRLLPKEQGMRPIINLRRRLQKMQHGELVLGKSINSILTPAFSALNWEKTAQPAMLGSAMFSVEDMYPRLQAFRRSLEQRGLAGKALYFAKVDVKACFDTIPQKRLIRLARAILGNDSYNITKYSRAKLVGGRNEETTGFGAKPSWRYLTKAIPGDKDFDFQAEVEADIAEGRTRSIYVDGVAQKSEHRRSILALLEEHVESNLIKLGNRFYRQKEGIPQGSIVSSLLCSYFYAELERKSLGFVKDGQSLLLRLIDDFLVISTQRNVAERFMLEMHKGMPEFGVEVKAEKSRANFDVEIDGNAIRRLPSETDFPYCGNAINTVTLNLSKDKERRKKSKISDSMSVEYSKVPGQTFYRKTLNALKLQMQAMLLSTTYNSLQTVLSNLQHSFTEVAQKSYHYIRSLPAMKQPSGKLAIRAIDDLIKLACILMKRRKRSSKDILPYGCCVSKAQARWIACTAFHAVFARRQTKHRNLLHWLEQQLALPALRAQRRFLESVVSSG